jgi:hypothetical protein
MALGLLDVIAPYFFAGTRPTTGSTGGISLGGVYDEVMGALKLREVDSCWDEDSICIWGVAGFDDPTEAHHTTPDGEVFDWHDVEIRFRLTAPLAESTTLASALASMSSTDPLVALVAALGGGTAPTAAPASQFRLDVLITAVTLHLPFARPAKLTDDGLLQPDPTATDVKLVLPKIMVTVTQGNSVGSLDAQLDSWGASGLDTEADLAEGTALTQDPPYALAGSSDSLFGWGFRSAVLDFSDDHTPPEILAIAGTGDDWKGLYFPEVRIFLAPAGIRGLAVDVGARDLLIGLGPGGGVSGDFDIEVVNQQGAVSASVRFQSPDGRTFTPDMRDATEDADGNPVFHGDMAVTPSGTLIVDLRGGQPPYQTTITVGSTNEHSRTYHFDTVSNGQVVSIGVSDGGPARVGKTWNGTFTLHPTRPAQVPGTTGGQGNTGSGGSASGSGSGSTTASSTVSLTPTPDAPRRVSVLDGSDANHVTIAIDPKPSATSDVAITLDGADQGTPDSNGQVSVGLNHADTNPHTLVVTWSGQPVPITQTVYFIRDEPTGDGSYGDDAGWTDALGKMSGSAVPDNQAISDPMLPDTLRTWAGNFPSGTTFTVDGSASHDSDSSSSPHNTSLAQRRIWVGRAALDHASPGGSDAAHQQYTTAAGVPRYSQQTDPSTLLPDLRFALITASQDAPGADATYTGTLQRRTASPPAHVETPPAAASSPPSWFRSIGLIVRLVQNIPVAAELKGVLRFADLASQQLASTDPGHQLSPPASQSVSSALDNHGLVQYDLVVEWDSANGDFRVDLTVAGGDGSGAATNWLVQTQPLPGSADNPTPDSGRDFAGLLTTLAPVMAIAAGDGDPVQGVGAIDVGFATVVIIAALGVIHTKSITLWGFEILTERHGDSWQAAALFDIEADLWFNVTIGSTTLLSLPPQKAMKVRYKAVGVRFGENDGQMVLAVAFDPSRGYELSAPDASAIQMPAPLGEILHLLAIRMARINPFQIEADIGLKADLGVVSVDRARVRLTLPENDGEQLAVTITALAASVNIPGALKGSGSLAIDDTGFDGSLDLALTSLGLRIAATLSVRQIDDATSGRSLTAVYASLEVDFPAPLPLLQSGLGIYGFIGLFGMHYGRTQDPPTSPDDNPALDWLNKAAPTAEINKITGPPPANNVLWAPQPDHWAVGLGVVLGTMDGGTILNLQGVVIVELPGPRIVIFVKAKFLEPKPATNSQVSATITALIEIDPDEILIGIIVEYDELAPLLKLRVPVGAFFQFSNPQNFHIDVGTFHAPATAKVLDLFDATAFVEIHGDQIDDVDPLVQQLGGPLPGLAIAAGIHAAIVWGDRSSGLYLEVTADAVVGVSFSPFQFLGIFSLRGALHLWIVSIEASAELDIGAITTDGNTNFWFSGEVCGEVDFLFFSVKGCVHVELGTSSQLADAPPLATGLTLQARTTSPVHGTATADRPVNASLTTASTDPDNPGTTAAASGTVPVDAIPVLSLQTAPLLASDFSTVGTPPAPAPPAQGTGWARRGQAEYRYTVHSVTLTPDGGAAMTADGVQSVFRTGNKTSGDDTNVQFALLDWSPDPADQIMLAGPDNDTRVGNSWGWVCTPVAEAANVLWTFLPCRPGPSVDGWQVGGNAFADAPGTRRSRPAPTLLTVHEPWRTDIASIDPLLGIDPAYIDQINVGVAGVFTHVQTTIARALAAPYERTPVPTGDDLEPLIERLRRTADVVGLLDAVSLSAGAATHVRVLLTVAVEMLKLGQLVIRPLDADENAIGADIPIPVLGAPGTPPSEWTASGFAGATDAARAIAYASATSSAGGHRTVLADTKLPDGTQTLLVGIAKLDLAQHAVLHAPSFTICAVELALVAEAERVTDDTSDADNATQTVSTATGSDPATRPLLARATNYTVSIAYDWEGRAVGDTSASVNGSATQSFSFATDSTAPTSLEPWLLYTFPLEGEKFHFTGEAPVICFASDDIDQLVGAYAQTLHVHVVPARADLVRTTSPLGALETILGVCLSTFEHTVQRLHASGALPCLSVDPGPRHGRATIDAPLDQHCDYTLDLSYDVAPSTPSPGTSAQPLLRRGFSTGAFATATDLATAISIVTLEHRSVTGTSAAFGPLGATPSDTDLDAALASIGLGAVAPPVGARIVVLWEQHLVIVDPPLAAPHFPFPPKPPHPPAVIRVTRPVAVLIDAPEPVWRTRQAPTPYTDPDTGTVWWQLADQDWLTVAQASGGELPDPDAVPVTSVIRNAAGTRVVCLLGASAGTGTPNLHITLNRVVDPSGLLDAPGTAATEDTLVQVQLGRAPWEETS